MPSKRFRLRFLFLVAKLPLLDKTMIYFPDITMECQQQRSLPLTVTLKMLIKLCLTFLAIIPVLTVKNEDTSGFTVIHNSRCDPDHDHVNAYSKKKCNICKAATHFLYSIKSWMSWHTDFPTPLFSIIKSFWNQRFLFMASILCILFQVIGIYHKT